MSSFCGNQNLGQDIFTFLIEILLTVMSAEHGDFALEINSIRSIYIRKFHFVLDVWLSGYLSGILGI